MFKFLKIFKLIFYLISLFFIINFIGCAEYSKIKPNIRSNEANLDINISTQVPRLYSIAVSNNQRFILSGGVGFYTLWDIEKLKKIYSENIDTQSRILYIAFSPDNKHFAYVLNNVITIRDIETYNIIKIISVSEDRKIQFLDFSSDGKTIVFSSVPKALFSFAPVQIHLYSLNSGKMTTKKIGIDILSRGIYFSKNDKYILFTSLGRKIFVFDSKNLKLITKLKLNLNPLAGGPFTSITKDKKYLLYAGGSKVGIFDTETLTTIKTVTSDYEVYTMDYLHEKNLLVIGGKNKLSFWNTTNNTNLKNIIINENVKGVELILKNMDIKFLSQNKVVGTIGDSIKIYDISNNYKEIASLITFKNNEWIIVTPEGYYNSSKNGDNFYKVQINGKPYTIELLRETFFRPDLVRLALSGGSLKNFKALKSIKQPPLVEIVNTPEYSKNDEINVTLKITDTGGGIGDIRLYLNDTAVIVDSARGIKITPKTGEKTIFKTYTVKLLTGENIIKAVAFNADNTMQSNPAIHKILASISIKKPSIYAVVIGINEYKNPKLTLKYAVADAKLFAETISQVAKPLFEKVEIKLLTTKEETTKEYIKRTLESYKHLNPEDIFVFYVASHGTVDDGEYFLITSNVGSLSTFRLKEDALTQAELKELIANVPSTKKFIVIDTCNAGKLGEALQMAILTRGMSEETAVKILSKAVGSTIISASTSLQEALEGYRGHGLFTYVLAEGLKGKADLDKDGFIKTLELATYVDSEVPTLADKIFKRSQYPVASPTGQSFPVGRVR